MKKFQLRIWLIQLPLVILWALALLVAEGGDAGTLESRFLRSKVYPRVRALAAAHTDVKFRLRGPTQPRQKIVIVEIDDRAVSMVGRWPWHRDAIAVLVMSAFEYGAKSVGLDIVFPEDDVRVSPGVAELLQENGLGDHVPTFETDLILKRIIDLYADKLVLGWMSDSTCRPFLGESFCDVMSEESLAYLPEGFDKFALADFKTEKTFDPLTTPILSAPTVVANIPTYNESAHHSGFLVSSVEEADEVVRRAQATLFIKDRPYLSLPLVMASIGLDDKLELALDGEGLIRRLGFVKSGRILPVSPTGALSINFRGDGYHFPYVGALDLLGEETEIPVQRDGKIETLSVKDVFTDAYVLIGVTAIGARDLRHFPFGSNTPGTEGLATILDNALTGDFIKRSEGIWNFWLLLLLMTIGAVLFCFAMIRLSAIPAVLVSLVTIAAIALFDAYYLFGRRNLDLNTAFLLGQLATIFIATVAVKYVIEERGKRVIRGTFSKYLAPEVVDEMLKDPDNLKLGGETRELTIMMSDLRGFTATAERLKAEEVLEMLNHYLGTMADIIVDYRGTIDEFIGDAILVIFGAPISRPDDARRAVACCLAMQKAMGKINEVNMAKGLPRLEMGIGLNTGEVTVGNIGSERRLKYGVVGSHVNLTARIESNTVGGQLLISESTLKLAGADIKLGEKYSIVAKGFPDPIIAYEVLGIGGEYDIYLETSDTALVELSVPLAVSFRVMKGKNDEGEAMAGKITSLSETKAVLESSLELEALTNLKFQITSPADSEIAGDIYAKVTVGGKAAKLVFTAMPPAIEAFFTKRRGDAEVSDKARMAESTGVGDGDAAPESEAASESDAAQDAGPESRD